MSLKNVLSTLAEAPTLLKVAKEVKPRPATTRDCFASRVESTAARFPDHKAVIFEGQTLSWQELNKRANRITTVFKEQGLVRGDAVSLVMENRVEFLTNLIALNKLGIIAALINTNLTGQALTHCINITAAPPSVSGVAFAAVTLPYFLSKAGRSLA